jgi:uncharacterized protein YqeY
MGLLENISGSIIKAIKSKNNYELESLRAIKSALLIARTQKNFGGEISQADEIKILQKLVKQRKESAEIYSNQDRLELAELELNQAKVIEKFLPKQLDHDEIEKIISEIIDQSGAQGMKDMGKVMGLASSQLSGKADGKTISNIVRSKLS